MKNKKGEMEIEKLIQIIIGVVVLVLIVVLIMLAKGKGIGAISYIKSLFGGA